MLAPTDLSVVITEGIASLAWKDPNHSGANPTSGHFYRVERSSEGTSYQQVAQVPIGTRAATIPGPYIAEVVYRFRVSIVVDDRVSPATTQVGSMGFAGPVDLVVESMTEARASLRWQIANSYATTVVVERSMSEGAGYATVDSIAMPATTGVIAGPYHADSAYYFRIYCKSPVNRSAYTNVASQAFGFPAPTNLALRVFGETSRRTSLGKHERCLDSRNDRTRCGCIGSVRPG